MSTKNWLPPSFVQTTTSLFDHGYLFYAPTGKYFKRAGLENMVGMMLLGSYYKGYGKTKECKKALWDE